MRFYTDNGKPSMIPRLKTYNRETPVKESSRTASPTTRESLLVTRNVQHVHHLNVKHGMKVKVISLHNTIGNLDINTMTH